MVAVFRKIYEKPNMRNNMIVCVTYCNLYITYIHICFTHCISVSISIYQYSNYSDIMMFFFARGQHNDHHLPARPGGPGSVSRGLKVKSPNFRMGPKKPDDVDDLVRPRCGNAAR